MRPNDPEATMNAPDAPRPSNGAPTIRWPSGYAPGETAVHVRNELQIPASPDIVWSWLVRAQRWPEWYRNAANVRFVAGDGPDLRAATRFRWKTFGIDIESVVREFEPDTRLSWSGRTFGLDVHHAWLLTRTVDGGCHVLTEETQNGFMARGSQLLFPTRMFRFHQIWLEALSAQANRGLPPG